MSHNVGPWIDHKKAVIVFVSGTHDATKTLESEVGPHARYSDHSAYATPDGPRDGGGEKTYEARFDPLLYRYYDEVVRLLARPEALLIFGPGEAKLQLTGRISRSRRLCDRIVGIETTDTLTNPQIVAKVKEHFGIARGRARGPRQDSTGTRPTNSI
jgi:hypothetical protein